MRRHIATLLLAAAVASSAGCFARVRVYDAPHRDYHRWDSHEDRAYRAYLAEQHRPFIEFRVLDSRDQEAYWAWRHNHPNRY
jgi:hypothetical protein